MDILLHVLCMAMLWPIRYTTKAQPPVHGATMWPSQHGSPSSALEYLLDVLTMALSLLWIWQANKASVSDHEVFVRRIPG